MGQHLATQFLNIFSELKKTPPVYISAWLVINLSKSQASSNLLIHIYYALCIKLIIKGSKIILVHDGIFLSLYISFKADYITGCFRKWAKLNADTQNQIFIQNQLTFHE